MKICGTLHKNTKILARHTAENTGSDAQQELLHCLEEIYKSFDIAEPVWLKKHAGELSRFGRTKFLPQDFLEPVSFDFFEVELIRGQ